MSRQQSNASFTGSSSFSFSSSSSVNGQQSGYRTVRQSYTDGSGTTVRSATQNAGQPAVQQTRRYDAQGRELLEGGGNGGGGAGQRRIEDVTDEQQTEKDREYEEKIEDEYAKREGGA